MASLVRAGAPDRIALFNYLDRSIITILRVPIKADLGLSDTQLGAMTGVARTLLYNIGSAGRPSG